LRKQKIFANVGNMAEIREQHVEELANIANKLAKIAEELAEPEVVVPPEIALAVETKVAERQCLVCGDEIPKEDRYVRGQCEPCATALKKMIKNGETSLREMILAGGITPVPKKGGRSPSAKVEAIEAVLARVRTKKHRDKPRDTSKPK
jgi:Zn finger protein HypA/HybF involved in hydrogenase expression